MNKLQIALGGGRNVFFATDENHLCTFFDFWFHFLCHAIEPLVVQEHTSCKRHNRLSCAPMVTVILTSPTISCNSCWNTRYVTFKKNLRFFSRVDLLSLSLWVGLISSPSSTELQCPQWILIWSAVNMWIHSISTSQLRSESDHSSRHPLPKNPKIVPAELRVNSTDRRKTLQTTLYPHFKVITRYWHHRDEGGHSYWRSANSASNRKQRNAANCNKTMQTQKQQQHCKRGIPQRGKLTYGGETSANTTVTLNGPSRLFQFVDSSDPRGGI